ncbi:hypothetical protein [Nostoc sp.]|uniref:hypothetical protein n=1 Tax=Nostoc sp. TaxID=1180 RepID=UPI002FF6B383
MLGIPISIQILGVYSPQFKKRSHFFERRRSLDISENECRDVAVLRLYKDSG